MNWRTPEQPDGPEPLPPEELLRIRRIVSAPPRPDVRDQHVAMAAAEARRSRTATAAQKLARRSARIIAGVAATVVVTSSLAGAQILVQPARAIFPAVSDLLPDRSDDLPSQDPEPGKGPAGTEADNSTTKPKRPPSSAAPAAGASVKRTVPADEDQPRSTSTTAATSSSSTSTSTSTSSSSTSTTSTTEPDGSTTTTTDPSTTTTTEPDPSTTTTTAPSTTTTTEPEPASTTNPPMRTTKAPPARADSGDGGGT